jgi:hypothetical protein
VTVIELGWSDALAGPLRDQLIWSEPMATSLAQAGAAAAWLDIRLVEDAEQ